MKNNTFYTVIMFRYGEEHANSYLLGIYDKKNRAFEEGRKEEYEERGEKYSAEVYESALNVTGERKIIKKREDKFKKWNNEMSSEDLKKSKKYKKGEYDEYYR